MTYVHISRPGVCNQLGNYATHPPFCISPTQGLGKFGAVTYAEGCGLDGDNASGIPAAVADVAGADAVVLVLGARASTLLWTVAHVLLSPAPTPQMYLAPCTTWGRIPIGC